MAKQGEIIDGKYEILAEIGRGGMSVVYLARNKNLNQQWAIKEVFRNARDQNHEEVVQSAIAEATMMKNLDHPLLPRIVDIIENSDTIYIIMDLIEGRTLQAVVEETGAQLQETVIDWGIHLCGVLSYPHSRKLPIIYRDMKPENIMLKPDGTIKLIDFGIAREYKEKSVTDTTALGTRGYAAPEQWGNRGQTDARTDIYGLGATLYHLVTGKSPAVPPYEIKPIRMWNPQLSSGLEKIILKCTQLDPDKRYQTSAELLVDLQHYHEMDDLYRKNQKNKMIKFAVAISLSVLFWGSGWGSNLAAQQMKGQNYENILSEAQRETSTEQKISLLEQAIDIQPQKSEAYLQLVTVMKAPTAAERLQEKSTTFTETEDNILRKTLNAEHLNQLKRNKDYSDVAYAIGSLYWYYYDYGSNEGQTDNQYTRMISALPWFEETVQFAKTETVNSRMADIYRRIAIFNRDISAMINEGSDTNVYGDYWNSLIELNAQLNHYEESGNQPEILKLETYVLSMNAIENYARKFKGNGITYQQMIDFYNQLCSELDEIQISEELMDSASGLAKKKAYLETRKNYVKEAIDRAFATNPNSASEESVQEGGGQE